MSPSGALALITRDALSNLVFSLWGAIAVGFIVFVGAVAWQLVKIARAPRGGQLRGARDDDDDRT